MAERVPRRAVGISGSPSEASKTRVLVERALAGLGARGFATMLVDLAALPADGLLGRAADPTVQQAVDAVCAAQVVVAGTPVYRASYSGLLKLFFDLLPQDALAGKVAIPIATGHDRGHFLALDHGLRPLFASLGATVVASGTYGTREQFCDGVPDPALAGVVERAVGEAVALARAEAE